MLANCRKALITRPSNLGDNVETFVRTCLICQQDKIEQKKSGGLLEPLPTPKGPWESVSMDFITCLPKSEGGGSIIVVVDRFLKYGTFIAAPPDVTADDTAKLFFKNVVKYWVNALLELYLRHYVSVNQHDWAKLLNVAQFSYNMQQSEDTGKSPFELVMRRQPLTPNALAASYEGSSPAAHKTIKEWHEQVDLAWASLDKGAKKIKKWADEKSKLGSRRLIVAVCGQDQEISRGWHDEDIRSLGTCNRAKPRGRVLLRVARTSRFGPGNRLDKAAKNMKKWAVKRGDTSSSRSGGSGPFSVIGRVGKVSYRVQLPPKLKIHPVFHVSFLKLYHGDEEDPERGVSKRAPTAVVTSYDREVEEILLDRMIRRRGVPSYKEYLIKWHDLPDSEASWEAEDLLWQFMNEIKRYHEDGMTRTSRA
ncbi:reverse transcriptase [Tanacetum coccineum]